MITEFRNVVGAPTDPVDTWPYEGMVEVIEYGNILDWRPLIDHITSDPWGRVVKNLEEYLSYSDEDQVVAFFRLMIQKSREEAEEGERAEVVKRVRQAKERSGLTSSQFAARIGTSASRFSTYLNGSVMPSAAMLVRMENISRLRPPPPPPEPAVAKK